MWKIHGLFPRVVSMVTALRVKCECLLVLTWREAAMKPSRMDRQDCDAELCIHLAPKCIAAFHSAGRPSQMNTYSSASLLYNMCSAFWVLLHSHKGFRYSPLGNTPPQCTPTLSIYILEVVLVLIFAAGQTNVSAAHIWDQLPQKRTFNRHWTHCHHQQQYSAPRKHCWMEWGMRLNYKCVFSLDYSLLYALFVFYVIPALFYQLKSHWNQHVNNVFAAVLFLLWLLSSYCVVPSLRARATGERF